MIYRSFLFLIMISIIQFASCRNGSGHEGSFASKIKYRQYYNNGRQLYLKNCSNCHQKDGSGLVRLYPPIKDSDYFRTDPTRIICIIRNGKVGEIIVNGISFNQPMPANPDLSNLEIAELTTYLYGLWSEEDSIYSPNLVSEVLRNCQAD